jgi:hypothetical protein
MSRGRYLEGDKPTGRIKIWVLDVLVNEVHITGPGEIKLEDGVMTQGQYHANRNSTLMLNFPWTFHLLSLYAPTVPYTPRLLLTAYISLDMPLIL